MRQFSKWGLSCILVVFLFSACRIFSFSTPGNASDPTQRQDSTESTSQQIEKDNTENPTTLDAGNPDQQRDLLPHSLYYLSTDQDGRYQIWKLAPDGKEPKPITAEKFNVDGFDISIQSANIAYLTNNKIIISDLDGRYIRTLVESEPDTGAQDWMIIKKVSVPKWSPDGSMIAYGLNGLILSDPEGENQITVLTNDFTTLNDGYTIITEGYSPHSWSPDGNQILVNIQYFEGGSKGLYVPAERSFIRLSGGDLCCYAAWAPDSRKIYTAGRLYYFTSDMWVYDSASGKGTQLIQEKNSDERYNFADFPFATDTHLYYYYSCFEGEPPNAIPLTLYKAPIQNLAQITRLRSDAQFLTEILWSSDGSRFLGVQPPPGGPVYPDHGPVVLIYPEDAPIIPILADGFHLRWGP